MKNALFCTALLGGFFLMAPSASAQENEEDIRPIFLVTEIVVQEGVQVDAQAAVNALAIRFGRLKDKLDVRSHAEIKTSLDHTAMQQMLGDDEAMVDIGDYLDVDKLVFGRITEVGGVLEISVRLFNVKEKVNEIALSRRLKKGAERSLVLTIIDKLADNLLAWTLKNYTDAKPSNAFAALKGKKIGGDKKVDVKSQPVGAQSPWGLLGLAGAGLAGVGVGSAALGGVMMAQSNADQTTALVALGAGAGAVVVGASLMVLDGME